MILTAGADAVLLVSNTALVPLASVDRIVAMVEVARRTVSVEVRRAAVGILTTACRTVRLILDSRRHCAAHGLRIDQLVVETGCATSPPGHSAA